MNIIIETFTDKTNDRDEVPSVWASGLCNIFPPEELHPERLDAS